MRLKNGKTSNKKSKKKKKKKQRCQNNKQADREFTPVTRVNMFNLTNKTHFCCKNYSQITYYNHNNKKHYLDKCFKFKKKNTVPKKLATVSIIFTLLIETCKKAILKRILYI